MLRWPCSTRPSLASSTQGHFLGKAALETSRQRACRRSLWDQISPFRKFRSTGYFGGCQAPDPYEAACSRSSNFTHHGLAGWLRGPRRRAEIGIVGTDLTQDAGYVCDSYILLEPRELPYGARSRPQGANLRSRMLGNCGTELCHPSVK
jgi:hypothetical protein